MVHGARQERCKYQQKTGQDGTGYFSRKLGTLYTFVKNSVQFD